MGCWTIARILGKTGIKVSTINKFKDMINTFFMAVCLLRDKTNLALQG